MAEQFEIEGLGVKVTVTESAGNDGAVVVFVDTPGWEPDASDGSRGLRVLLNDDSVYDGVGYRPDPTDDMDDDEIAEHNRRMADDPQYRDAIYYERH